MATERDVLAWEVEKFQKCYAKISCIVHVDKTEFTERLMSLLEELNELEYSLKIAREEVVSELLIQCCHLVAPNNEQLLIKFCQLICNCVSRQQMILVHGLDTVTEYFVSALKKASAQVQSDLLWALSALLYENGGRLTKFHELLVGSDGMLIHLCESGDEEVQRTSLQCVENICIRTPNAPYLLDPYETNCLLVMLKLLHSPKPLRMEEVVHCRMLVCALRGIQNILLATKTLNTDHLGPLLAAVKTFGLHGMAGHISIVADTLYPTPMSQYDTSPLPTPKAKAADKDHAGDSSVNSSTPKGPGKKGKKKRLMKAKTREDEVTGDVNNATGRTGWSSAGPDIPSLFPLWSKVSSSESEYSDTEGGQISKLRSYHAKVRQCAFACFHAVVKATDRRVMFGFWTSFLPDSPGIGGVPQGQTLFTTIMKDPSPKVRTGALAVLTALLDGSKHYLMSAEDGDAQRAAFTPFSVTLGYIAKELHRCLLLALVSENSPLAITQIIKCLAALVPNVPYHRLKPGVLTRIVKQVKPFLHHRDPNIRVACLTCLGSVVSVHAPLLEVYHILQSGRGGMQRTSGSSSSAPSQTSMTTSAPTDNANSESGYHSNQSDIGSVTTLDGLCSSPNLSTPGSSSGMQTPTLCEQLLQSSPTEASWVVRLCVKNVCAGLLDTSPEGEHNRMARVWLDNVQPLPVRLESLQLLAQLSKSYFPLVRPCLSTVCDLIHYCLEDKDQSVQLHGAKLLEEAAGVLLQQLQEPQNSSRPLDISEVDKRMLCITLLLGLTCDDGYHVRAAAIRALGVYVLYPCLREDVSFVADVANAILTSLDESNLSVKIKAAWALGNLSDALVLNKDSGDQAFMDDFSDMLLRKLFEMATRGSQDSDKVKSNAVRALGNLLRYLPRRSFSNSRFSDTLENGIQALIKNVSSGTMKVRWNACYATANMLNNQLLPIGTAPWSIQMYHSLSSVVRDCKNFKVRINAAMAFSVPSIRRHFGDTKLYKSILDSLVIGLVAAETVSDFAEYRYRDNLTEQVCGTLVHLIGLVEATDLTSAQQVVGPHYDALKTYVDRYKHLLHTKQVTASLDRVTVWKKTQVHLMELSNTILDPDEQTSISILMDIFEFSHIPSGRRSPTTETSPQSSFRQTYD